MIQLIPHRSRFFIFFFWWNMAATSGPPPPTGQSQAVGGTGAADELTTTDEVKEYCHEGEGEKTEHLNSMDLTDIKSELEKDAEEAEVSLMITS